MVLQKSDFDGLERLLNLEQGPESRIQDRIGIPINAHSALSGARCRGHKISGERGCQCEMRRSGWTVSAIGRMLLLSTQNPVSAKHIEALGL
jgi:hypothetical protein